MRLAGGKLEVVFSVKSKPASFLFSMIKHKHFNKAAAKCLEAGNIAGKSLFSSMGWQPYIKNSENRRFVQ